MPIVKLLDQEYDDSITELKFKGNIVPREICNLINLQNFYCEYNKITEISREIGNLINLQIFYCNNNKITEIKIGNLVNLQEFFCNDNKITKIPREIGNLINLQEFYCSDNKITEIPREICNCRNLEYFEYSNNEIEHIPPDITRFLNRLYNGQNIYSDTQSVHNHNIQTCIKTSIQNIMNFKPVITNYLEYIMQDCIFTELTKQSLIEYSNYEDVHTELNITFKELLIYVINRIEINPHKDEIKRILNDEIKDSLCKCFTGRISRLINCLNGFDPEVNITISDNEQISQIIILTRELLSKDYTVEKHKELTIKELKERGYSDDIIKEWIDFIG